MAVHHLGIGAVGEGQKLIDLVGGNVNQDATKLGCLEKPIGPNGGIQSVRSDAQSLDGRANGTGVHHFQSFLHGRHNVPLRKANREHPTRLGRHFLHPQQLRRCGHAGFVHQHIFAMAHGGDSDIGTLGWDGCANDEVNLRVF